MQITEERKKRLIDLYFNQHKSYAEIAQIERISPRDIHTIIKEEETRRQKHKQQELSSKSYQLFSEGKTSIEVAIILNLPASKVSKLYSEYWKNQIGIVIAENNTAKAMETRIKSTIQANNRSPQLASIICLRSFFSPPPPPSPTLLSSDDAI